MDRYTRKDAERSFWQLCASLGKTAGTSTDHGAWVLDYASEYGGFLIEQVDDVSYGVSHPLGDRRQSAREFCYAVNFALRVLEVATDFDTAWRRTQS